MKIKPPTEGTEEMQETLERASAESEKTRERTEKEIVSQLVKPTEGTSVETITLKEKRRKSVKNTDNNQDTSSTASTELADTTDTTEIHEINETEDNDSNTNNTNNIDGVVTPSDDEVDELMGFTESKSEQEEEETSFVEEMVEIPEEEQTDEVKQVLKTIKEKGLSAEAEAGCPHCHGTGYRLNKENEYVVCDCVLKFRKRKALEEINDSIKTEKQERIERVLYSKDLGKRAWQLGLIPPENAGRRFNETRFWDVMANQRFGGKIVKEASARNVVVAFNNILHDVAQNKKTHSYFIYCPSAELNEDFAITMIKAGLMYGKSVVPYTSLVRLAKKKTEYITDSTWRRGDGYLTREEELMLRCLSPEQKEEFFRLKAEPDEMLENADYIDRLVQASVVEDIDANKMDMIYNNRKNRYTYQDYIEADILVCWLSAPDSAYTESTTLSTLLEERAIDCKPTIILSTRNIKAYKTKSRGIASDIVLIDSLITDEPRGATYRVAEYVGVDMKAAEK